jgi:cytochrome c oxidase assembly protein Cox11
MRPGNRAYAAGLAAVIACMVGLSFASVPLYRLFCAVTGYAGTPNITNAAAPGAVARTITVSFNADVDGGLPWSFAPVQTVFPQDRLLLLQSADVGPWPGHAVPAQLLGRSRRRD